MKVIVVEEKDISQLMENLDFEKLKMSRSQLPEEQIHRHFRYVVVKWIHEHGSNYPAPCG